MFELKMALNVGSYSDVIKGLPMGWRVAERKKKFGEEPGIVASYMEEPILELTKKSLKFYDIKMESSGCNGSYRTDGVSYEYSGDGVDLRIKHFPEWRFMGRTEYAVGYLNGSKCFIGVSKGGVESIFKSRLSYKYKETGKCVDLGQGSPIVFGIVCFWAMFDWEPD